MGDLRGRRAVLVPIILIMAGATAAVAFLPGYAVIGILAPVTLIMLRTAQGLAAGGELGVAGYSFSRGAPSGRRGHLGSLHTATLAIGLGLGMAVASLLLVIERADPSDTAWWRLAFLLALPLGLVGGFVRRRVSETTQFLAASQAGQIIRRPIPALWLENRVALIKTSH